MRKLLIIDDDDALRRLLRVELAESYEVIDTGEPEQGLALALEHRPHAILLDLRMPSYSGYDLCQRFKSLSLTQGIPVIIVSGEAGTETKEYCRNLGAIGYFEKPIDFVGLKARLNELATPRTNIPRNEVSVPLRVLLKLCGHDASGRPFEDAAMTENVSLSGFLCTSALEMPVGCVLKVYMTAAKEEYVGRAQVVHGENGPNPLRRYDCRFIERTGPWVLQ